jgi:SAM-dependent methyltransferase
MIEPMGLAGLAALASAPGETILDIGCGCGRTTLQIAEAVGTSGAVVGADISATMLAEARARAIPSTAARPEFREVDAQTGDLGRAKFDAAFSRFGVMFFADPVAAFANIRSAAKRGGELVFVSWQPRSANQWLLVPAAALAEHVPGLGGPGPGGPAPGDGPGMFALADPDRIRQVLTRAGWRDVTVTAEQAPILVGGGGSLDETVEFLRTSSIGRTALAGVDQGTAARALASVRAALAPHADDAGVRLNAAVWLVKATA